MNWDIAIGHGKQLYGRLLQNLGARAGHRRMVLAGERMQYSGRLQTRYGSLKHQVQWSAHPMRMRHEVASMAERNDPRSTRMTQSGR